jgi:hypothetical protein
MNADDFDKKFGDGVEDAIDDLDLSTEGRPCRDVKRVSADLPLWTVDALDNEAVRPGGDPAVGDQSLALGEDLPELGRDGGRGRAPQGADWIITPASLMVPSYAEYGSCSRHLLSTAEMQLG